MRWDSLVLIAAQDPYWPTEKIEPAVADYDASGFSITHGFGRVNAYKALMVGCRNITVAPILFLLLNE